MRKVSMVIVGLLLVSMLALAGACASAPEEVIREVPVEVVVEREVIKEMPVEKVVVKEVPMAKPPAPREEMTLAGQSWATERMIVRSGNMNLKVKNVAEALDRVKEIAEWLDGYVVSSSWRGGEKESTATISIRVPAEKYDDAVKSLRDLAIEVLLESTKAKDVTEEYTDLESQLRNLEATESRYLALLDRAKTVEEILKIERMLSETRGQIEQTKGRMQYLERTSATSLIEIYLVEERPLDVDFIADKIEVREGERVRFNDQTTGGSTPYGYNWDFGNGDSSTDRSPTMIYDEPGSYTVSLKVTDVKGSVVTETKEDYVTVVAKPGWSAGNVAKSAWRGLVTVGHVLGNIVIWVGILSIIWIPIGLIVYWFRRRRRRAS